MNWKEKRESDAGKIMQPLLQSMARYFFERKSMPKMGWLTFAFAKREFFTTSIKNFRS
jgi:hypothetical protein